MKGTKTKIDIRKCYKYSGIIVFLSVQCTGNVFIGNIIIHLLYCIKAIEISKESLTILTKPNYQNAVRG